jgi:hypothetical protein
MRTDPIDNSEQTIDSRDIIARIEELQEYIEECKTEFEESHTEWETKEPEDDEGAHTEWLASEPKEDDYSDEQEELDKLLTIQEECNYGDWEYGVTLVNESYWEDYCQELCEDIGDFPKDLPSYISCHIDWEGVSRDMVQDYTTVNFDGVDFYVRLD